MHLCFEVSSLQITYQSGSRLKPPDFRRLAPCFHYASVTAKRKRSQHTGRRLLVVDECENAGVQDVFTARLFSITYFVERLYIDSVN